MGFVSKGVWVMGYHSCMGYEALFPVNQLSGLKNIWFKGVWGMWAMGYEGVDCNRKVDPYMLPTQIYKLPQIGTELTRLRGKGAVFVGW